MTGPTYHSVNVDGLDVFYREEGNSAVPTLLLLHGFPTSSHMFRDLIPLLSDRFHIVAPDLPGFGHTSLLPRDKFSYTFDNLAKVIDRFTEVIGLDRFALYIFDYGAPTGLRIALAHPRSDHRHHLAERKRLCGGTERWLESHPALLARPDGCKSSGAPRLLTPQSIRWQYTHGVSDPSLVAYGR